MSEETLTTIPAEIKPGRILWVDAGRGFMMLYLVITVVFPPGDWKPEGSILFFLTGHPGRTADYMTLFDIGAAAFIFVLGLLYAVAFYKRKDARGTGKAIIHILIRYALILIAGFIIIFATDGEFTSDGYTEGFYTVIWDVLPSLGLVGFVALPFVFLKSPKIRLIVGYVWMLLYQILLNNTELKFYAQNSIHGGIFGTIFGYSGILIVASAVGQLIFDQSIDQKKKYTGLTIFAVANLAIGWAMTFIPNWEAAKRQVSFTHCLISIGATVVGMLIFALMELKFKRKMTYLRIYGQNPFLVYVIAEIPIALLTDVAELIDLDDPMMSIIMVVVVVAYTSGIMYLLHRKKKVMKTERVAMVTIIVLVILAVVLIATGML